MLIMSFLPIEVQKMFAIFINFKILIMHKDNF